MSSHDSPKLQAFVSRNEAAPLSHQKSGTAEPVEVDRAADVKFKILTFCSVQIRGSPSITAMATDR